MMQSAAGAPALLGIDLGTSSVKARRWPHADDLQRQCRERYTQLRHGIVTIRPSPAQAAGREEC